MPSTRRLQVLSIFAFFASVGFLTTTVETHGIAMAMAVPLAASIASALAIGGLEYKARREDEVARMNRAP